MYMLAHEQKVLTQLTTPSELKSCKNADLFINVSFIVYSTSIS